MSERNRALLVRLILRQRYVKAVIRSYDKLGDG